MARQFAVDVLLGLAVAVVLASSVGVLVMRDAVAKLHFVTPISIVAALLVGLAVLVQSGFSVNSAQAWLTVLLMAIATPFLSHATVRAARIRATAESTADRQP